MSTSVSVESAAPAITRASSRVVSIDIFRGFTMAVMIFVNAVSDSVHGLPWWSYHAHAEWDAMTYVDMVFPTFLFIVGMSMPLSVEQRLKRDASMPRLWLHVFIRSVSLLVLGLILANAERVDEARTGMHGSIWALLGLISAGLYLNVYPRSERFAKLWLILRGAGLVGVTVAFVIFRGVSHHGHQVWIEFGYPEILGLIGFAYFAVAVLYIPTRNWRWAAPAWFILLVALNAGSTARVLGLPVPLSSYIWPFDNGAHVSIVMAGVVTSQIFLGLHPGKGERPSARSATIAAFVFAAIALVGGWIAMPLGISKIRATPTWSLWSVAAAVILFTLLYWICDQWKHTAWAALFKPAGANTLLTYLLPDLTLFLFFTFGITWMDTHLTAGAQGVLKCVAFTVAMLGLSWLATRARLRLQL